MQADRRAQLSEDGAEGTKKVQLGNEVNTQTGACLYPPRKFRPLRWILLWCSPWGPPSSATCPLFARAMTGTSGSPPCARRSSMRSL